MGFKLTDLRSAFLALAFSLFLTPAAHASVELAAPHAAPISVCGNIFLNPSGSKGVETTEGQRYELLIAPALHQSDAQDLLIGYETHLYVSLYVGRSLCVLGLPSKAAPRTDGQTPLVQWSVVSMEDEPLTLD